MDTAKEIGLEKHQQLVCLRFQGTPQVFLFKMPGISFLSGWRLP